ncbi:hypothetical protein [Yersinia frederiksenii]|uniref:hypothetical protein n=1 Tax=Yersinia frederiksenii TaxID=29484 RepID=UPI0011A4EAC2|nr:hypothetical protein [Yersinia frederiksenii]
MEEITNSVKNAISKRLDSPLFGFILLSWFAANWSNILFVLFSERTIEERIKIISKSTLLNYFCYLLLPVLIGVSLAIIYPYAQGWIDRKHAKAIELKREREKFNKLREYEDLIDLAEIKAKSENATLEENTRIQHKKELVQTEHKAEIELINKQNQADLDAIEAKSEMDISTLKEKHQVMSDSIIQLDNEIKEKKEELIRLEHSLSVKKDEVSQEYDHQKLILKACEDIITLANKYNDVSDTQSFKKITLDISRMIMSQKNLLSRNNLILKSVRSG